MTDTQKIPFIDFWILYNYKVDKKKCVPKWNRLKAGVQKKIIDYLPGYIKSTPDKLFRKHPATFLNNESWENEIIEDKKLTTDFKPRTASPTLGQDNNEWKKAIEEAKKKPKWRPNDQSI